MDKQRNEKLCPRVRQGVRSHVTTLRFRVRQEGGVEGIIESDVRVTCIICPLYMKSSLFFRELMYFQYIFIGRQIPSMTRPILYQRDMCGIKNKINRSLQIIDYVEKLLQSRVVSELKSYRFECHSAFTRNTKTT